MNGNFVDIVQLMLSLLQMYLTYYKSFDSLNTVKMFIVGEIIFQFQYLKNYKRKSPEKYLMRMV